MSKYLLAVACIFITNLTSAQQDIVPVIDSMILVDRVKTHLSFLASDEMRGRDVGSPEIETAAQYIRNQFIQNKLKPAPSTDNFFQQVDLLKYSVPAKGIVTIGKDHYKLIDKLLVLGGASAEWSGEYVYVGYGSKEELAKVNIKGKMVLALAGSREADNINKVYAESREKFAAVKKAGAAGLVEILAFPQVPWSALVGFFHKGRWGIKEDGPEVPFVWIKPKDVKSLSLKPGMKFTGKVSIEAAAPKLVAGKNVAGLIEGTDPELRDEYVVLTAHYDHIGVQKTADNDSIFNGARDNATGTVALLQAAKVLAANPPKRSVLVVALTGEEKGLLGSQWYVKHPLVPLQKHVLNINCDGVGYNDITRLTSISLGRTNLDHLLIRAGMQFELFVGGDPDPSEGFYERSDQVSFAREGIPAIKIQPGLERMDERITKYYHRAADEVSSLDLDYLAKFYKAYVYSVYLCANYSGLPKWSQGDKFEEAFLKLYGVK